MTVQQDEISLPQKKINWDFWKYWTGQTISNLGSSVTLFALPLLVYTISGSALSLGISSAANMLPYLFFGLVLGAWADRIDRKRMMIYVDIARASVIATIPLMAAFGHLSVWWIYGVGFVHTTLSICFDAGEFAAIPSLVDQNDLVTANGRIQASYSAASILGPVLAGLLVAFVPLVVLVFLDAFSFLLSALSIALIATSFNGLREETQERKHIARDVAEGLRYVWGHPVLRNISLMMALVNFVSAAQGAQLVLFAKERLHASNTQVGFLYTAGSIGVVILALLAGKLRKRWPFSKVALIALMCNGLFILALSFTRWYWLALVFVGLLQGCGILFNINTGSLRQAIVPNHMLGRVMSIASVLAWSAIPLGALLGGAIINQTHNVALVYSVAGVLVMLIPVGFLFTPLGRAERYLPQTPLKPQSEASQK
ncbi:MFS transporter [Dictyobacter formicarum]|uniref:MFS transporter n=1 Tax=Dictyobacter formicarum TaxID=2778368 RepID=A0ABQ3VMK1_9CHLR|nr:MFS transporter [Dictyobacter formicarum]GHO87449.1 MFS transporter [Dictyobacter formicarum]